MICKWCGETVEHFDRICRRCKGELPSLSENGGIPFAIKNLDEEISKEKTSFAAGNSAEVGKEGVKNDNKTKRSKLKIKPFLYSCVCLMLVILIVFQCVVISKLNECMDRVALDPLKGDVEIWLEVPSENKDSTVNGVAIGNGNPEWIVINNSKKDEVSYIKFKLADSKAKGKIEVIKKGNEISIKLSELDNDFGKEKEITYCWEKLNKDNWEEIGDGKNSLSLENDEEVRCTVTRKSTDGGELKIIITGIKK